MGSSCGTLNVRQSALVTTWTDREIRHGPSSCYCYNPFTNSVEVVNMIELKMHEYALLEDTRDPSKTKYVYGPLLFRLEHAYQQIGPIQRVPVLDQNDYLTVVDSLGVKRTEVGPKVFQPTYGESWSSVMEAVMVQVNQYIVIMDKSNPANPIRHKRGPAKVYPGPYDEIIPDDKGRVIRACIEINDTNAVWLKQPDGQVFLVDQPQFLMPQVGEVIERFVTKTILKESEFCIIITPTGENVLKMGNNAKQRAFFLPPFHRFLPFRMGDESRDYFSTLPTFVPNVFTVRTSDNVQVKLDLRISFQIFQPEIYTVKPIDFYTQIQYWVQNDLLDAYAKQTFREFLKTYADHARRTTEASHSYFNEFGLKLLDVQLINYTCVDPSTQKLLEQDIITRVTKQNELQAKETDVDIMKREKAIQLQKMDIDYEKNQKENEIILKKKELDVAVRIKEVELQIEEEKRRSALMEVKRMNAVKEGTFEGQAQGESVRAFLDSLPADLSPENKVAIWSTLRDMEKSAMIYSKVGEITMMPPGTELRKLQIMMDDTTREKVQTNPLMLPSILGYSSDQQTGSGANNAANNFSTLNMQSANDGKGKKK